MPKIKLTNYRHIADMPVRVVSACKTMGQRRDGHLCEIINEFLTGYHDRYSKEVRSAYVLEVDDKIVGWICLYKYAGTYCSSVWVRSRERGKGYGKLLMDMGWKRWYNIDPRTYKGYRKYWLYRQGQLLDRRSKLSPNACVSLSDSLALDAGIYELGVDFFAD